MVGLSVCRSATPSQTTRPGGKEESVSPKTNQTIPKAAGDQESKREHYADTSEWIYT